MLDAADQPLRPAKLWNDTESAPQAETLAERAGTDVWVRRVGSVDAEILFVHVHAEEGVLIFSVQLSIDEFTLFSSERIVLVFDGGDTPRIYDLGKLAAGSPPKIRST